MHLRRRTERRPLASLRRSHRHLSRAVDVAQNAPDFGAWLAGGDAKTTAELQSPTGYAGPYADWNVDLDGDGSSDDPWKFGSATEYPVLNLGTLDIDHGNLNPRPPR